MITKLFLLGVFLVAAYIVLSIIAMPLGLWLLHGAP